jgi:ribosomal protein L40E
MEPHLNKNLCEKCGVIVGRRQPHAIYCKKCADMLKNELRGTRKTYKRLDLDVEWNEILAFCLES